ncbi:MAG: hypothetical protein R3C11_08440 [Planctomycetaceae bacterium]
MIEFPATTRDYPPGVPHMHLRLFATLLLTVYCAPLCAAECVFPGKHWETRTPQELNVDAEKIQQLEEMLRGRGCIIKNGYVIHSWGINPIAEIGCRRRNLY